MNRKSEVLVASNLLVLFSPKDNWKLNNLDLNGNRRNFGGGK